MNSKEQFFNADDIPGIIQKVLTSKNDENKFRYLYNSYTTIKNHILSKKVDIEEILDYISSYFGLLFTSPEALEIEPVEVKETITASDPFQGMQMPPGQANPQMMQLMQMLNQSRQQNTVQESFTNIENEFYSAVIENGIIMSDRLFMQKVFEQGQEEFFDLILKKSNTQLSDTKDLKSLYKCMNIWNAIAR